MAGTPDIRGPFSPADLPDGALVVLIGTAGSGKSTLATRLFRRLHVLSSDRLRGWISDDEGDQEASADAFDLLYRIVRMRLARGRLTVVDATNVTRASRARLLREARAARRPAVAVVLDVDVEACVARDAGRRGRRVGRTVIETQRRALDRSLPGLESEGFDEVRILQDTV